jgi:hypothetical protein
MPAGPGYRFRMTDKRIVAATIRRSLELIHGRPLNRRERAVLAEFLLQAPIEDEHGETDRVRSRTRHDLDST